MGHEVSQMECKQPAFLYGFTSMEVLLSAKRWRAGGCSTDEDPLWNCAQCFRSASPQEKILEGEKGKNDKNPD